MPQHSRCQTAETHVRISKGTTYPRVNTAYHIHILYNSAAVPVPSRNSVMVVWNSYFLDGYCIACQWTRNFLLGNITSFLWLEVRDRPVILSSYTSSWFHMNYLPWLFFFSLSFFFCFQFWIYPREILRTDGVWCWLSQLIEVLKLAVFHIKNSTRFIDTLATVWQTEILLQLPLLLLSIST